MQLHSDRENRNPVTFGDRKRKWSYTRREKREMQLDSERKGKTVTSGERKGKCSYIREDRDRKRDE